MTLLPISLEGEQKKMFVDAGKVELVLIEDSDSPLSLILAPFEDLHEIAQTRKFTFSLSSFAHTAWAGVSDAFEWERKKLELKTKEFGESATFLNRLANLARLSGDLLLEREYITRAKAISDDTFFDHRMGENFISTGMVDDAEVIFRKLSLRSDIQANLRVAYFQVQRRDIPAAREAVARAVRIDPLNFAARLFEGSLSMAAGQYQDAVRSFRVASEERPNSSVLHSNLAIAYVYLNLYDKALGSLRRAIALDPLNRTAVIMLADLAFERNRNDEAVPALRFFSEMEQGDESVWARLARALLEIGNVDESLTALKRQASIKDRTSVWNNLGVAYYRKGPSFRRKAYEAFRHALRSEFVENDQSYLVAVKNLSNLLFEDGDYRGTIKMIDAVMTQGNVGAILSNRDISDLGALQIASLEQNGSSRGASELAYDLANRQGVAPNLAAWAAAWVLAYSSFEKLDASQVMSLVHRFAPLVDRLSPTDSIRRDQLINNLAFALIEIGELDYAEHWLHHLSQRFHRDPYPTATLGLLHFRRGHVEKGKLLYDEAVRLAVRDHDKRRIKQKRNLELGIHWLAADPNAALRYLNQAIDEKKGVQQIADQAVNLRLALRRS